MSETPKKGLFFESGEILVTNMRCYQEGSYKINSGKKPGGLAKEKILCESGVMGAEARMYQLNERQSGE